MRYSTNQNSVSKIKVHLAGFEKKLHGTLTRKTLRGIGRDVEAQIRGNVSWNDPEMRRTIKTKIKTYKRGRLIWMGIGVIESALTDWKVKVRAHAYDKGWVPYPKGRPTNRKGKGWRSGLRRLGGTKIWATHFITSVRNRILPTLGPAIKADLSRLIMESK